MHHRAGGFIHNGLLAALVVSTLLWGASLWAAPVTTASKGPREQAEPSTQQFTSAQRINRTAAPTVHRVARGQTLEAIARRYNISVSALCRANNLGRRHLIHPGQRLSIPSRPGQSSSPPVKPTEATPAAAATDNSKAPPTNFKAAQQPHGSSGAAPLTWQSYRRPAPKAGFINLRGTAGSWSGYAILKGDVLSTKARAGFRRVLASWRTGKQVDVPERLIRLLVTVSDTFGGRPLRIVGGYREHSYARASKHQLGHAVDFAVEGVPNTALRDYLLTLPRIGVGFYPNSSFIHLDIRPRSAYWVDHSGPGQRPVYTRPTRTADDGPIAQLWQPAR